MPANRMEPSQPDLRDSEAKETNSPEQTEVESDQSRNLLLLKVSPMHPSLTVHLATHHARLH